MPAQNKDDISFGFDPTFFNRGINKMLEKLGVLKDNTINVAKAMSMGFMQIAKKAAVFVVSMKGIKGLFNQIPEIGKAFGIAKEIAFKNFFYPLRQAVYPLLQKMLLWVRDNRKTFVIWGQALANVFNIVVSNLKGVITFGKQLGDFFLNFINRIFGTQLKSFEELINMITFKLAVTIEYLKTVFEPIGKIGEKLIGIFGDIGKGTFESILAFIGGFSKGLGEISPTITSILNSIGKIVTNLFSANKQGKSIQTVFRTVGVIFGDIVRWVTSIVDAFLKEFEPAIKEIATPVDDIMKGFQSIFNSLFGSNDAIKNWKDIFGFIGKTVGETLVVAFELIANTVKLIDEGIKNIITNIKTLQEWLDPKLMAQKEQNVEAGKTARQNQQQANENAAVSGMLNKFGGPPIKAKDVIITKKGDVIQTDPDDNIMAFKKSFPGGGGQQVVIEKIDFSGMKIYTQGTSNEDAATFGGNVVSMIIDRLNQELVTRGIA